VRYISKQVLIKLVSHFPFPRIQRPRFWQHQWSGLVNHLPSLSQRFSFLPFRSERAGRPRTNTLEYPADGKRDPMWAKQEGLQSDQRLGQERNEESRELTAKAEENVGVESTAGLDLGGSINIREAAKTREWEQTWSLAVTPS
jgi:hypothetical protein